MSQGLFALLPCLLRCKMCDREEKICGPRLNGIDAIAVQTFIATSGDNRETSALETNLCSYPGLSAPSLEKIASQACHPRAHLWSGLRKQARCMLDGSNPECARSNEQKPSLSRLGE